MDSQNHISRLSHYTKTRLTLTKKNQAKHISNLSVKIEWRNAFICQLKSTNLQFIRYYQSYIPKQIVHASDCFSYMILIFKDDTRLIELRKFWGWAPWSRVRKKWQRCIELGNLRAIWNRAGGDNKSWQDRGDKMDLREFAGKYLLLAFDWILTNTSWWMILFTIQTI